MWLCDTFFLSSFHSLTAHSNEQLEKEMLWKCIRQAWRTKKWEEEENKNKTINLSSYKWKKIQIPNQHTESFMRI